MSSTLFRPKICVCFYGFQSAFGYLTVAYNLWNFSNCTVLFFNYFTELTDTVCLWYSDVPKRLPAIVLLLSQQGFPNATRVVLNWLGNYFEHCRNYQTGKFPNKQQLLFLIDSFIFFKTDQVQVQVSRDAQVNKLGFFFHQGCLNS